MLSTRLPLSIYTTKTPIDMWRCNLNNFVKDRYQLNYCFVSNTSMHRQLLGYLCGFLLCHYVSMRSEFRVVLPVAISATKRCSVRRYHQLFQEGSCLNYVICVCLRIVVSNAYCVLFFLVLMNVNTCVTDNTTYTMLYVRSVCQI